MVATGPSSQITTSYGGGTYAAKNLIIQATDVSGGSNGIFAVHGVRGELSITTTGTVQGNQDDGISAASRTLSSLVIDVVDVS